MKPGLAIVALEDLKSQADIDPMSLYPEGARVAWCNKVMTVMEKVQCQQLSAFSAIRYQPVFKIEATPSLAWESAFRIGLSQALGLIDAAIYELRLITGEDDSVIGGDSFDPELWAYVKGLVESQDWDKLASAVATFVEDRIRAWTGSPETDSGVNLFGKGLFAHVLGKESELQLGNQPGEREGWLLLGMGFAQALGNSDRHNVKTREDLKLYALGVLGLGSLLLTQFRYQHSTNLSSE